MRSHRKLTLKSAIVYAITFTAGIIVGWLVKPQQQMPEDRDWGKWLKTHPPTYDSSGDTNWEKLAWRNHYFADAKENEVTCYVNKDDELLGMWDRVLTDDEIKRVRSAGEDGIRASFEDTQPIG